MEKVIQNVTVKELNEFFGKGRIATVVFVKKGNGEVRVLNGKTKVFRGINGEGERYNAESRGQVRVFDVNLKTNGVRTGGYRTVTAENVLEVRANGNIYKIAKEVSRIPSESFVSKPRYDATQKMFNLTLNGNQYTYLGVPENVVKRFINSASWGVAFNELIRGRYDYLKG